MTLTVQRVPNQPIIIATLSGALNVAELRQMFAESVALFDEIGAAEVWRITDVSHIQPTITDLFASLAEATKKSIPGSPSDPRFRGMLVGSNQLVKLFAKAMHDQRYGHLNIPLFDNVPDALDYALTQIETTPHPA